MHRREFIGSTKSRGTGQQNQTTKNPPGISFRDSCPSLSEAAAHPLESMCGLLENPLNDPVVVVAEIEVLIQGGKAMPLTGLFVSSNCGTWQPIRFKRDRCMAPIQKSIYHPIVN